MDSTVHQQTKKIGFCLDLAVLIKAPRTTVPVTVTAYQLTREGYLADILLVEGDPAKDVTILQDADKLSAIMKGGVFCKAPDKDRQRGVQAAE